jgi:hypothetical protein
MGSNMGLLNGLFSSSESIAKHGEIEEQNVLRSWREYLSTVPEKEQIINRLPYSFGQRKTPLLRLKQLLDSELVSIHKDEKEEEDLIPNLRSLEHSKKIKRVHRLKDCLKHTETQNEYVLELLFHLHSILKSEKRFLEKLTKADLRRYRKLVGDLKSDYIVEQELLEKIKPLVSRFHSLFQALARGEHFIRNMDTREKKLLRRMQGGMGKIFNNKIKKGITYEWVGTVFDAIEDRVHDEVANGMFPGHHPDIDFEFANRLEFIFLVRETIQKLKKTKVSEQMINIFVHIFREWYNHERD